MAFISYIPKPQYHIQDIAPYTPIQGDRWYEISTGREHVWDGTTWISMPMQWMDENKHIIEENEKDLLKFVKTQLGITNEDMKDSSIIKSKIREYLINKIIE